MVYSVYNIRVVARAIITKVDTGLVTLTELVQLYPESEKTAILAEVYRIRLDLAL